MLIPVFAGRTHEGELVIIYKDDVNDLAFEPFNDRRIKSPEEYYIRRPDGDLCPLEPSAHINVWQSDNHNNSHIKIQSSAWTGEARGSRLDLIEAKIVDRNR